MTGSDIGGSAAGAKRTRKTGAKPKTTSPGDAQIRGFARVLFDLEDGLRDCLKLRRMGAYRVKGDGGKDRLYDELVNYLSFCVNGDLTPVAIPPCAMYLDALLGIPELWTGETQGSARPRSPSPRLTAFPMRPSPACSRASMRWPFPTAFPPASFRSTAMRPSPNS